MWYNSSFLLPPWSPVPTVTGPDKPAIMRVLPFSIRLLCLLSVLLCARLRAQEPTSISCNAPDVTLQQSGDVYQLLVDVRDGDDRLRDATSVAMYESLARDVAGVSDSGVVTAHAAGQAVVRVRLGELQTQVDVHVVDGSPAEPTDFENDVTPYLTRYGCNMAACHAKAGGQNGLQFSVFGFDTRSDFEALVCDSRGRRVSLAAPDSSLFLLKATQSVPHVGGQRFSNDSQAYQALLRWVQAGAPYRRPNSRRISEIRITPGERRIDMQQSQQLRVTAVFDDGSEKDVTHMARYRSNNEGVLTVSDDGKVTVGQVPGHAAVMASYLGQVDTFVAFVRRSEEITPYPDLPEANFIDALVHQNLKKLNMLPSEPVADADYLRRVYLDIIGTLPTAEESRQFLTDSDPERRSKLVNRLLERSEYAKFWALRWADLLHVDRSVLGHRHAYAYYRWIRNSMRDNLPLDEFATEILTASGPLDESPQGGFFQALTKPGDRASALSQVFLGIRIDCAECHHHPFDRWSQEDYYGMTAFFAGVTPQPESGPDALVFDATAETRHPLTEQVVSPHPLGVTDFNVEEGIDPRDALTDWLTSPDNQWFARNLANRMWAHFFGRGLVEPIDDVRETNPSVNDELLSELAEWLREQDYDQKSLIRLITSSQSYQRSAEPGASNRDDTRNASRALLRPLPAEVLLDAISQTTGVPADFDEAPAGTRAIELWDSKIQHPFLRLFGRPERKTACECERISEPNVGQVLLMMNSPEIFSRLTDQGGTIAKLVRETPDDEELIEEIYLTFLSRFPDSTERKTVREYLNRPGSSRQDAATDLAWSLMNTLEFCFNH